MSVRRLFNRLKLCFREGNYEFKDVNLNVQADHWFPGRKWGDLDLKDQVDVVRRSLNPEGNLIDPHSYYMKYWDVLIILCLVFLGIVTPYEVIFIGPLTPSNWLFVVNRFVDVVFLKDMIMQFFLKVHVQNRGKAGRAVVKDPWIIRRMYLTTWFPIDLIGVMQFDLIFMAIDGGNDTLQGIKFLRMVRLLRLMKLVRMLRGSRALQRWQNYMTVSFAAQKLIKFSIGTLLCSHWMACFWGLVGFSLGKELCFDGQRIDMTETVSPQETSWVTTLYLGGKYTPDDPCMPWHVYTAALHWSVMTITSIGYGDIVPVRSEEYLACVFCMLAGGVLWANIIAGTCAVIARGDPVQDNFEKNTDLLNGMMEDHGIPKQSQYIYREFLREAKVYDSQMHFRQLAHHFSPQLKGKLLLQIHRTWTTQIPYLRRLEQHTRVLMILIDALEQRFFSRKEILDISSDRLCICERGTVARGGKIVIPGGVFHVDFIVAKARLRRREETVALTYSLIMNIRRDNFLEVVHGSPELMKDVAKASMVYAMSRCIHICAEEYKMMRRRGGVEPMSFADVFDRVVIEGQTAEGFARSAVPPKIIKVNFLGESEEERDMDTDMYPSLVSIGRDKTAGTPTHGDTLATAPPTGPVGRRFPIRPGEAVDTTFDAAGAANDRRPRAAGPERTRNAAIGSIPLSRDEFRRLDSAEAALRNALEEITFLRSRAVVEPAGYARASTASTFAGDTGDISMYHSEIVEAPSESFGHVNCCRTRA